MKCRFRYWFGSSFSANACSECRVSTTFLKNQGRLTGLSTHLSFLACLYSEKTTESQWEWICEWCPSLMPHFFSLGLSAIFWCWCWRWCWSAIFSLEFEYIYFLLVLLRKRENFRCTTSSIGVQSQLGTLSTIIKTIDPQLHQHLGIFSLLLFIQLDMFYLYFWDLLEDNILKEA